MRIAIFYDFIIERGGVERVIKTISKNFKSKIFTCFYDKDRTYPEFRNLKIFSNKSFFNKPIILNRYAKILRTYYFFNRQLKNFSEYINKNFDIALFSGFYSFYFAKYLKIPKIYYIQAEPFFIALDRIGMDIKRNILLRKIIRKIYNLEKFSLSKMDYIVANSFYTKKIYEDFYNLDVQYVVYPPVNIKGFYYRSLGDFCLYVGRLYLHKRVHVVVEAFKKMDNKKLIIVGDGPLKNYVIKAAKNHKNILYLGNVEDKTLKELYSTAETVVYITEKEPFGLVPVEANASGKPCIVSNEGGLKEIITNKKVGVRINKPYLKNLVNVISNKKHLEYWDKNECIKNAKRFDEKFFVKNFEKIFRKVYRI
ncbi:MAG: glycosyltransferase [Candidatus Aenigmatarchaeota archaeon]